MPELPEVETIRRDLEQTIKGLRILAVRVLDGRVIRNRRKRDFIKGIQGQTIVDVQRRGKALIFPLEPAGTFLVAQLMMTGQLVVTGRTEPEKATKLIFTLSNQTHLHYNDFRLFGRLQIVRDLGEIKYFQILGPEPLSEAFHPGQFGPRLKRSRRPIKNVLLDHTAVAGIGNIYASEILFVSGIRPQRPACSLSPDEVGRVVTVTKKILRAAVKARGTSMSTYRDGAGREGRYIRHIRVYGRQGQPCPGCGTLIEKVVMGGRSTFFCPECQE